MRLYVGSPAFQGIVEADSPVEAAGVLGGLSEGGVGSVRTRMRAKGRHDCSRPGAPR
jgi:hypothetical protein